MSGYAFFGIDTCSLDFFYYGAEGSTGFAKAYLITTLSPAFSPAYSSSWSDTSQAVRYGAAIGPSGFNVADVDVVNSFAVPSGARTHRCLVGQMVLPLAPIIPRPEVIGVVAVTTGTFTQPASGSNVTVTYKMVKGSDGSDLSGLVGLDIILYGVGHYLVASVTGLSITLTRIIPLSGDAANGSTVASGRLFAQPDVGVLFPFLTYGVGATSVTPSSAGVTFQLSQVMRLIDGNTLATLNSWNSYSGFASPDLADLAGLDYSLAGASLNLTGTLQPTKVPYSLGSPLTDATYLVVEFGLVAIQGAVSGKTIHATHRFGTNHSTANDFISNPHPFATVGNSGLLISVATPSPIVVFGL